MRMSFTAFGLFLGLLVATASPAQAQGNGVIVGLNFANLDYKEADVPESDRRTGLVGGVFVNMPLGSSVSIQPEFLYSQKGAKFTDAGGEATVELDYLDIPVLARITSGGRNGLVIVGGPSFGFKLRARSKIDANGTKEDEDIGDEIESFDFGIVVGAGIQGGSFFLDGRYQWGRSNINKSKTEPEVRNKVISVLAGIKF